MPKSTTISISLAIVALCGAAFAVARPPRVCVLPTNPVFIPIDQIPPDACLELFGAGPCQPHGAAPTTGWTEAVAGSPPGSWHGKVEVPKTRPVARRRAAGHPDTMVIR